MKAQPSPLIDKMANRLGSGVLYQSGGRTLVREYVKPAASATASQVNSREAFASASAVYSSLTPADRLTWELLAAATFITDTFGQSTQIPAKALCVRVNSYRLLAGLAPVLQAPPPGTGSPVQLAADAPSAVLTLNYALISPQVIMALGVSGASTSDGSIYLFSITNALSGPAVEAAETDLRLGMVSSAQSFSVPFSTITILCVGDQVRFDLSTGQRVGVMITTLSSEYVPVANLFVRNIPVVRVD